MIDFSHAVGAPIVTSFAISAGTRDAGGRWTTEQARQLLAFTKSTGGGIAAAEFMKEPYLPALGGAPEHYDAAAYGRDFATFRAFMKDAAPEVTILGPGVWDYLAHPPEATITWSAAVLLLISLLATLAR